MLPSKALWVPVLRAQISLARSTSLTDAAARAEQLLQRPMTAAEVANLLAAAARRKGLQLVCCIAPHTPANVAGDAARMRQLLANLLGNAIKFTEHGEVVLSVQQVAAQADGCSAVF